jgi:hypothetical protein
MTGDGLWDWITSNMDKFVSSFKEDVSRMIGIEERFIENVQAKQAEGKNLLADAPGLQASTQAVAVSFTISSNASSSDSALDLGKKFQDAVNKDNAAFTSLETSSGIVITANVSGVANATATGATVQTDDTGTVLAIVLPIVVLLGCCAIFAWWQMSKPDPDKDSKSARMDEIVFTENEAATRGPEGRTSSLAGSMSNVEPANQRGSSIGGRGLETAENLDLDVEIGEMDDKKTPAQDRKFRLGQSAPGNKVDA